jgi:hypothetical protein
MSKLHGLTRNPYCKPYAAISLPHSIPPQLNIVFSSDFTVPRIELFAGIRIRWTDNLTDHLCLAESELSVGIFHHVAFLAHIKRNNRLVADL